MDGKGEGGGRSGGEGGGGSGGEDGDGEREGKGGGEEGVHTSGKCGGGGGGGLAPSASHTITHTKMPVTPPKKNAQTIRLLSGILGGGGGTIQCISSSIGRRL